MSKEPSAATQCETAYAPVRPGPGRPRKGHQQARNRTVLSAAFDLFLEKGFDQTTLADILAAAGIAKRTLLQQYGSKADILRAATEQAVADWIIPADVLRGLETDDREETLQIVAERIAENASSPLGLRLMRMTNAEASRHPDIGASTLQAGTQPSLEYLSDLFRRRFSDGGEFADAENFARSLLSMIVAPARLQAWGAPVPHDSARAHARHCVNLFLHGMLSQPR